MKIYISFNEAVQITSLSVDGTYGFLANNKIPRIKRDNVFVYDRKPIDKIMDDRKKGILSLKQKRAVVIRLFKKGTLSTKEIEAQSGATCFSIRKWIKEYQEEIAEKKPEKVKLDPFKLMASCLK